MKDIGAFVREMNRTWQEGRFDDLAQYFHQRVVMLLPGSLQAEQGVEPMVESYRGFSAMAKIHRFDLTDVGLFPFENVVMCHARFTVDYEIPSGRFEEEALEIYAVDTAGQVPKILWRTQMQLKEAGS